jgi:hypothetical protein
MVLGALFLLLFTLALPADIAAWPAAPPAVMTAGDALWKGRTFEVILQGIMILSGVMSILLLLGAQRHQEGQP